MFHTNDIYYYYAVYYTGSASPSFTYKSGTLFVFLLHFGHAQLLTMLICITDIGATGYHSQSLGNHWPQWLCCTGPWYFHISNSVLFSPRTLAFSFSIDIVLALSIEIQQLSIVAAVSTGGCLGGGRVTQFPFGPLNVFVFVYISNWATQ